MSISDADKAFYNKVGEQAGVGAEGATGLGTTISQVESEAVSLVGAQLGSSAATSITAYAEALDSSVVVADSKAESAVLLAKSAASSAMSASSSAAVADSKGESAVLLANSAASSAMSASSSAAVADSKAVSAGRWDLAWSTFTSVVSAGSIGLSAASVAKASYATEGNAISTFVSCAKSGF